jgi:hypothetical protein
MTDTPPEAERPVSGSKINPAHTVLIKIAGTLMVVVAAAIFILGLVLMVAFDGNDPILLSILRDPVDWGCLLFTAAGVGLIVYARQRETLYRQSLE